MRTPALATVFLLATACAQEPKTTPETTEYRRTSTLAEVQTFLAELRALPHADRIAVSTFGKSHEGRDMIRVRAALPGTDPERLRALVIGNIHAGEVEGKEAIQMLLREIASGQHQDLLRAVDVTFVPIYNVDGNERIDPGNRATQNGPEEGVGQRANAMDRDLNRDFVKAETPETRRLLGLMNEIDPHLFMDLHTTNGSHHGYHLTYAPCLSPNQDEGLATMSRTLLEEVRATMREGHSFEVFDYGNFETRDWDGSGAPSSDGVRGWWTYDHRPRYVVNGFGLRNRIGVLSEAYSYCDFRTRIAVTRAFVLETLRWCATNRAAVQAACATADQRTTAGGNTVPFGFDTGFGEAEQLEVLVGEVDRVEIEGQRGQRLVRKDAAVPEKMPVVRRFTARKKVPLPESWVIPEPPAAAVETLKLHGIATETLVEPREVAVQAFHVTSKRKPKRPYQGHQELVLEGEWRDERRTLAAGSLVIPARQPKARLAAQLLEPLSEDSLSTWNFLEETTGETYPVLRLPAAR